MPPLPRQHSAAIGCTKNYQPIRVTVHSHCVESFEGLLQRCRRGRGCSEMWKKYNFSLNTLYEPSLLGTPKINRKGKRTVVKLPIQACRAPKVKSLIFFLYDTWLCQLNTIVQNNPKKINQRIQTDFFHDAFFTLL